MGDGVRGMYVLGKLPFEAGGGGFLDFLGDFGRGRFVVLRTFWIIFEGEV